MCTLFSMYCSSPYNSDHATALIECVPPFLAEPKSVQHLSWPFNIGIIG